MDEAEAKHIGFSGSELRFALIKKVDQSINSRIRKRYANDDVAISDSANIAREVGDWFDSTFMTKDNMEVTALVVKENEATREDDGSLSHPSFGTINISRGQCSENVNLFGSSILHRNVISITIHRAILHRDLNRDWIMPKAGTPSIVEVEMSTSQFADAITSFNQGEGTPCTITHINGMRMEEPPFESKRVEFDREFQERMKLITNQNNQYYMRIAEILDKPSIGKHDREEIFKQLDQMRMQIQSNVPFIKSQFTEQMDKTVGEAKAEFDSHVDSRLKQLGLEGFKKQLSEQKALEEKK